MRFMFTEPRRFHLKGQHNQKTHGGDASRIPDLTDTVKTKDGKAQGVATEYQDYKGEQWLKIDHPGKKKWHKADDLEVVSKGAGISGGGDEKPASTKSDGPTLKGTDGDIAVSEKFYIGKTEHTLLALNGDIAKVRVGSDEFELPTKYLDGARKTESTSGPAVQKVGKGAGSGDSKTTAPAKPQNIESASTPSKSKKSATDFKEISEDEMLTHATAWESSRKDLAGDIKTLHKYAGNDDAFDINSGLRDGTLSEAHRKTVDDLTKLIDSSSVPRDIVAYRGVVGNFAQTLIGSVGKKVTDSGFSSTTISKTYGEEFTDMFNYPRQTAALIEVRVPKGTKGLYVSPKIKPPDADDEYELLLQRGTKYRVVSATPTKNNPSFTHTIVVEVEP